MREILDTRFLLEHFVSSDAAVLEKTRMKLRELRRAGKGVIPTVVLAEFLDQVCERAGRKEAEEKVESLLVSGLSTYPLTPQIAIVAGGLRCTHRGVPMADCIIAATAIHLNGKVVSDDPHFKQIRQVKCAWI